jgi:hypothetical protein
MRNGRVIMGTAARQFEDVNKKYLRQGALVRRRFLLNGFLGDDAAVGGIGVFALACGLPTPNPSRLREGSWCSVKSSRRPSAGWGLSRLSI